MLYLYRADSARIVFPTLVAYWFWYLVVVTSGTCHVTALGNHNICGVWFVCLHRVRGSRMVHVIGCYLFGSWLASQTYQAFASKCHSGTERSGRTPDNDDIVELRGQTSFLVCTMRYRTLYTMYEYHPFGFPVSSSCTCVGIVHTKSRLYHDLGGLWFATSFTPCLVRLGCYIPGSAPCMVRLDLLLLPGLEYVSESR